MGRARTVAARLLASSLSVLLLAACGAGTPAPPTLLTDWSGVHAFVVSDMSGRTVLQGIDTARGRVDPVAVISGLGDTRADRAARVLQLDSTHYLLVLASHGGGGGLLFDIDTERRSVVRRAATAPTDDLLRVGAGFLGAVRLADGSFAVHRFDGAAHQLGTVPLGLTPSYDAADALRGTACYADGDGAHQEVAVFRADGSRVARTSVAQPGNPTGVTCAGKRVVLAVGDLPGPAVAPGSADAVAVSHPAGTLDLTVVATRSGSSGRVAFRGTELLTDVPAAHGRSLVSVDLGTGRVRTVAQLPGFSDVSSIEVLGSGVLVVGSGHVLVLGPSDRPLGSATVAGDLYDMHLQLAGATA